MNGLRGEARTALAIARKDAMAELRGRHATVSTLFFAAVVLLLFGFALGPDSARLAAAAPGLLWLAVVFAGILAVSRLHLRETDDGALEQLALMVMQTGIGLTRSDTIAYAASVIDVIVQLERASDGTRRVVAVDVEDQVGAVAAHAAVQGDKLTDDIAGQDAQLIRFGASTRF